MIAVDGRARERDLRRAGGRRPGDPVYERRVVKPPDERRHAARVDARHLDADELVLRPDIASLTRGLAQAGEAGLLLKAHLQGRLRAQSAARGVEAQTLGCERLRHSRERAVTIRRRAGEPDDALEDPGPRRRVGPAERDVAQRRILDRADLLLAREQVDDLGDPRRLRRGCHPQGIGLEIEPVELRRVVELSVEDESLATDVHRARVDHQVAGGAAAQAWKDGVAAVGRATRPDRVEQPRPALGGRDRDRLVDVRLEA